jgi:hypothetical protein
MHVKAIECVIKLSFSQESFSSCLVHFCLFIYLFRLLTCLLLPLVLPSTWKKLLLALLLLVIIVIIMLVRLVQSRVVEL